ncbi:methyltransferase domain-containing protein [Methylotenera sp.]|uniref:methyltransferase domain-containing protein n=1 Tax=Methylotenera sp. TaxID=2051956 RepID=UPI00248A8244|nr:methyltransferase domain-containing protein [Methylotenera sp.]MDI1361607.1 methyltransferase domain-containing protein [Methylotenera sp.]
MHKKIKLVLKSLARVYGAIATLPFRFKSNKIDFPENVSHSDWVDFLSKKFNKKGIRVLEIGSRNFTGANLRSKFSDADYTGFDFYAGENVDVVGDAHKLSSYFKSQQKFDLIFSSAVFEHLHMPWIAAMEIQKMLKVDGFVFIETHFSFSSHERPWHFFQFSDMGLRALFNDSLGFDLVDSGMSNPISGYFSHNADVYLRHLPITELYCHSEILCKKRCEVDSFEWSRVTIDGIVEGTRYPMPK